MTRKRKPRQCLLCRTSNIDAPFTRRVAICDDCDERIEATGQVWCAKGAHAVPQDELIQGGRRCRLCDARHQAAKRGKEPAAPPRRKAELASNGALSDSWFAEHAPRISLDLLRREFASNPASIQEARRQHVQELIAAERQRGQAQPSYLARHAREIYGEVL